MFSIDIYFSEKHLAEQSLEYARGHMRISDGKTIFSSEDLSSKNSMLIFNSITDLLDGVRNFCRSNQTKYQFIGNGCRFSFEINSIGKENVITITSGKKIIKSISKKAFLETLRESVSTFTAKNGVLKEDIGIFSHDFYAAIEDFDIFLKSVT